MSFGMAMKPGHYRSYMEALNRLESVARAQKTRLPRVCAEEHRDDLVKAILTQRYKGPNTYPEYSDAYAKWKKGMLGSVGKFWLLFGDLLHSLTAINRGAGGSKWFAGIQEGAMDSGGKQYSRPPGRRGPEKSIPMYAGVNEQSRPLFEPARTDVANNQWATHLHDAFAALARSWRR